MPFRRLFFLFALFLLWLLPMQSVQARVPLKKADEKLYEAAFKAMDKDKTPPIEKAVRQGKDVVLNKILKTYLMAQPGNKYSFEELARFITSNPDWPDISHIRMIAEQKIPSDTSYLQTINWFKAYPPLTAIGFYRYMDALDATGQAELATKMIRSRWVQKDFCKEDLNAFRARYAPLLRARDHFARMDRLLWDHDYRGARKMYPLVTKNQRKLAEARMALSYQKGNVDAMIKAVSKAYLKNEGLLFDRLQWRRKKDKDKGAVEILLQMPKKLSHPEKWWKERHIIIRRLLERKNFPLAYRLATQHGQTGGFPFAQAEFLSGWLALRFLARPDLAAYHFQKLIKATSTPVSQARGYYWLGRTYEAQKHIHEAEQAYESAAALNTTFYGQIATTRLYATPSIYAAPEPEIPQAIRDAFYRRDLTQAIKKLYKIRQPKRALYFYRAALRASNSRIAFALLIELAYDLNKPHWAVIGAKAANQKNFIVRGAAYPVLDFRLPKKPDPALTHALIRQESQFQHDAGSRAGARGLMQLMPSTARHVAHKVGVRYRRSKLLNPAYNIKLGTYFIQQQIDKFDGSYIMALAGYNAGPNRVRKWNALFGDPRKGQIDPIDWIELIPIYETRNYVQRIIENLQFYRTRLAGQAVPLEIQKDIMR